jgi:TRAP-type C4-dicarboxylate transport system permease small subunit
MLDWIERLCNRVNDWDLTWVGFRALRPPPERDMTARVVGLLCLVCCPLSAVLAYAITRFTIVYGHYTATPPAMPWVMAVAAAVAFVVLQSLLAYFWNRRARRLRAEKQAETPV